MQPTEKPELEAPVFDGARRPDRRRVVDAAGVALSVVEWGEETAPPLLMAHGGFDFAETLNVFAPMIAAGGWRVVSWDHRGHGDSAWTPLYSWDADNRDAAYVLDSIGKGPIPMVGHSKGGVLLLRMAEAMPHRVSHMINLDGLPSRRFVPDVAEQRMQMMSAAAVGYLDHRVSLVGKERPPGTVEELAARRARMNPRLNIEWLKYLVQVGAKESADGWRWKIDPKLRMGGIGPWRPEWAMTHLPGIGVPFLGVLGMEIEMMGWGTRPEDVIPWLPAGGRLEQLEGVGHFVHIEQPRRVADLVLEFLS